MSNPLSYATEPFWKTVKDLDRIIKETGTPITPFTDQLRRIATIDTDAIARVADQAWGLSSDAVDGLALSARLDRAITVAMNARSRADSAWSGVAASEFRKTLESFRDSLEELKKPATQVGQSLMGIKQKLDQSIFDVMAQISSVAGIIGALAGLTVSLMSAPEAVVTKVLGIIAAVVTLITSIVTFVVSVVKSEVQKYESINAAADSALSLQRKISG